MLFSEPPKKYLDIVRIIAQAEQKNLIDRKQNFIDYEELLSVGIIAVQVLTGKKTAEELEKYSSVYLASSIHWAFQSTENEQDSLLSQYMTVGPSVMPIRPSV